MPRQTLSHRHRVAIADVALKVAALDLVISKAASLLVSDNEQVGDFLRRNLDSVRQIELLRILLESGLPHKERELSKMFSRISECRQARNEIIHWVAEVTESGDALRFRSTTRGATKELVLEEIRDIAREASEIANEVILWMSLRDALQTGASRDRLAQLTPRPSWVAFALRHWPPAAPDRTPG